MSLMMDLHRAHVERMHRFASAAEQAPRQVNSLVRVARVMSMPREAFLKLPKVRRKMLADDSYIPHFLPLRPRWGKTAKQIIYEVSTRTGVAVVDICSQRRTREYVAARYEAMWRIRNETPLTTPQIGRAFGGRDHTTVLYGIRRHQAKIDRGEA